MKNLKNKSFWDSAGFLGYKLNIRFLTEKLPYSQICGTKSGTSYKKRRHSQFGGTDSRLKWCQLIDHWEIPPSEVTVSNLVNMPYSWRHVPPLSIRVKTKIPVISAEIEIIRKSLVGKNITVDIYGDIVRRGYLTSVFLATDDSAKKALEQKKLDDKEPKKVNIVEIGKDTITLEVNGEGNFSSV